jgi:hypothetical protein
VELVERRHALQVERFEAWITHHGHAIEAVASDRPIDAAKLGVFGDEDPAAPGEPLSVEPDFLQGGIYRNLYDGEGQARGDVERAA